MGRRVWTSAATALAVGIATGTVHAAPLAQSGFSGFEVPEWLAGMGVGAVVLYVLYRIIAAIAAARSPAGIQDTLSKLAEVQSKAEDNRAKEIELEERRRADQITRDNKRDEQTDRMLAQLEKVHTRMHDNEAASMRNAQDELSLRREFKNEVVSYHDEVKNLATEVREELLKLTTRLAAVENSSIATARRIGTDDSVASIQVMINQLSSSIARLVELAAHPPVISSPTEATKHETPSDPTPNPTAVDPARAGADTGANDSANTGDNPQ